jgi:hypothetical protein
MYVVVRAVKDQTLEDCTRTSVDGGGGKAESASRKRRLHARQLSVDVLERPRSRRAARLQVWRQHCQGKIWRQKIH